MDTGTVAALAPILVLLLALQVYCLYDLTKSNVRYLPKWAWAVVLLLGGVLAQLAYLAAGREHT
ncbi:MAG TPA: PLD nuclease N-terminal domain-containing protein [Dehalococcoidia bacterium]|nr:PLD nuclease N-terminal domain-containing protein [Dehalococcoidia bacterium]